MSEDNNAEIEPIAEPHPPVLLDPEDRKQVERLMCEFFGGGWTSVHDRAGGTDAVGLMQAALRSLVAPGRATAAATAIDGGTAEPSNPERAALFEAWNRGYTAGCDDTESNRWGATAADNPYMPAPVSETGHERT